MEGPTVAATATAEPSIIQQIGGMLSGMERRLEERMENSQMELKKEIRTISSRFYESRIRDALEDRFGSVFLQAYTITGLDGALFLLFQSPRDTDARTVDLNRARKTFVESIFNSSALFCLVEAITKKYPASYDEAAAELTEFLRSRPEPPSPSPASTPEQLVELIQRNNFLRTKEDVGKALAGEDKRIVFALVFALLWKNGLVEGPEVVWSTRSLALDMRGSSRINYNGTYTIQVGECKIGDEGGKFASRLYLQLGFLALVASLSGVSPQNKPIKAVGLHFTDGEVDEERMKKSLELGFCGQMVKIEFTITSEKV